MYIDKSRTACFSGHRPNKFPFSLDDKNCEGYKKLRFDIECAIMQALNMGYDTFLCGMAKGFDLLCGEVAIELRREQQYIQLIAVLPNENKAFIGPWGELHRQIRRGANHEISIQQDYSLGCFHYRNRFMIENSSHIICYMNSDEGGTAYTVSMAEKQGLSVINLCQKN